MPYSVSPFRNYQRRGPNPTKNCSTLILNALAVMKWPVSWMSTMVRMATTYRTTTSHGAIRTARWGWVEALQRLDDLGRPGTGPGVGASQGDLRNDRRAQVLVHARRDHLRDLDQPDLRIQEGVDGDLVGR